MKALKWIAIALGALVLTAVVALLIIPLFVDLNDYKPEIEKQVSAATGRPFAIGGDIDLSLFPWAGMALSDIHLGNPAGFEQKEMIRLEAFEVRVKLLPLIFRELQVKRLIVQRPRIVLIRPGSGPANWEGIGPAPAEAPAPSAETEEPTPDSGGLPIQDLAVGEFSISDGSLLYIDEAAGTRRTVTDLNLNFSDVSLDRPVAVTFSAMLDERPISIAGTLGPIGRRIGKDPLPVDVVVKALGHIEVALKGRVTDAVGDPGVDIALDVKPFSPRKAAAAMDRKFPVQTADPDVLDQIALKLKLSGGTSFVSVSDGALTLDDTQVTFSGKAEAFSRPEIRLDGTVDEIDLDRYLPPKEEGKAPEKTSGPASEKKSAPIDYGPLRTLILDARVQVGKLKAADARMERVRAVVKAKGGIIEASVDAAMYRGTVSSRTVLNVTGDAPKTSLRLDVADFRINPLLADMFEKDFLEGATEAQMALSMTGDNAEVVKQSLSGEGQLRFKDGAIKGIDLASMARNVQSAFGAADAGGPKPRTDFSELVVPFSLANGVFKTAAARMASPFVRVQAAGKADLVRQSIDFRIEPKLVATLKGQGDAVERSGISVPVVVSGTFSSPKFAPDLEGLVRKKMEEAASPDQLKKLLPSREKDSAGSGRTEEKIQDFIKGLPFGGSN